MPVLLTLKPSLVDPWFQTLYYYQVKLQLRLYQVFYHIVEAHFDAHQTAKQVHEASIDKCAAKLAELSVSQKRKSHSPSIDSNLPPVALGAAPPQYTTYGSNSYQTKSQQCTINTTLKPGQSIKPPIASNTQESRASTHSFSELHKKSSPLHPPMILPARNQAPGSYVIALVFNTLLKRE